MAIERSISVQFTVCTERRDGYKLLRLIMQGKIKGKRSIVKLRTLRDWFNCSTFDLFRAAISPQIGILKSVVNTTTQNKTI